MACLLLRFIINWDNFNYSQLKQSEEAREAELEDLNTITEEFTARLADFEQRQQATVRVSIYILSAEACIKFP